MNCPKCNSPLSKSNRCDRCGEDVTIYKKVVTASNMYYNDGLKKVKVRDLTGAIISLKESLKLYKKNTQARNLLGLIYYEMGETVAALSEWVISKHFQSENNDADRYMNEVQNNPTKLDTMNQAIKKYNAALISAKQENEDLAIIQLKKVIALNSHFIRAYQLLALLYMKNNEMEKARKCLQKVKNIDATNTTTLRYLKEIGEPTQGANDFKDVAVKNNHTITKDHSTIIPVSSYKEEKPNVMAFVTLIIGIILGIAVLYWLIVPTITKDIRSELNKKTVEFNDKIAVQSSTIDSLNNDKKELQDNIDQLQKQIDNYKDSKNDDAVYDNLLSAAKLYIQKDKDKAAEKLVEIDATKLTRQPAIDLFNLIKDDTFHKMSSTLYEKGHIDYSNGKYEEAVQSLLKAYEYDETNVDAVYFLGRSYQRMNDKKSAKQYYDIVIDKFADSSRATEAKSRLNEIK